MDIISRSAIVLRPKPPLLKWMKLDDEERLADSVFKTLTKEPSVYLVPDWERPEELKRILQDVWPALFEAILMEWTTDPSVWPEGRTIAMFHEWFALELFGTVEDVYPDLAIEYG